MNSKKHRIGWISGTLDLNEGAFLSRVYHPHLWLQRNGHHSVLVSEYEAHKIIDDVDVVIFHRTAKSIGRFYKAKKLIGIDANDHYFKDYYRYPYDFILTDSLPNLRYYHSRRTFYWPHGFDPKKDLLPKKEKSEAAQFVYCGYSHNLDSLSGIPLEALGEAASQKKVCLKIITNLDKSKFHTIKSEINKLNIKADWVEWNLNTYESEMLNCDVGFFPQKTSDLAGRRKSIYKAAHAASLGLPSIISPTEEAVGVFLDGVNALIPNDKKEWMEACIRMTDAKCRKYLSEKALELFKLRFTLDHAMYFFLNILENVSMEKSQALERRYRYFFKEAARRILNPLYRYL